MAHEDCEIVKEGGKLDKILVLVTENNIEIKTIKTRGCEIGHELNDKTTAEMKKIDKSLRERLDIIQQWSLRSLLALAAILVGALGWLKFR